LHVGGTISRGGCTLLQQPAIGAVQKNSANH
jgi:hypothetical protein